MKDPDPASIARFEGAMVEANLAYTRFVDAAQDTLTKMKRNIVRDFPQFYTWSECKDAGVSRLRFLRSRVLP